MDLSPRWSKTWQSLTGSISENSDVLYQELLSRYAESHRKYHTLLHVKDCLDLLETYRHLALFPAEMEWAFWFHDAVYDTSGTDNELRSAEWAQTAAQSAGAAHDAAERIHSLVMATRHTTKPAANDEALLVDIDLAILGAEPERFDTYEQSIREEYAWVPDLLYRRERQKVLEGFLSHPRIFNTDTFMTRYERQARSNIQRSLAKGEKE